MFINLIARKLKYYFSTSTKKGARPIYEDRLPQDFEVSKLDDEDVIAKNVRHTPEKNDAPTDTGKKDVSSGNPQQKSQENQASGEAKDNSGKAVQQETPPEDKNKQPPQQPPEQSPEQPPEQPPPAGQQENKQPPQVSQQLKEKVNKIKEMFGGSNDLKIHEFLFGQNNEYSAAIIYIDGLIDNKIVIDSIMRPLINYKNYRKTGDKACPDPLEVNLIKNSVLFNSEIEETDDINKMADGCLNGNTVLIVENYPNGLIVGTKGYEFRAVTEPQTEAVVKGPREGFVENLRTNTSLIRRKIKSTALRIESFKIGRKTNTAVCMVYLDNVAKPELVNTVRERLKNIEVDSILESGYIDEYIEDNPYSIFSTIGYTEKPDVAAGKILEGRVAVVVDGTPFVLTMPMLFIESLQTSEDYYNRSIYSSLTRMLKLVAFMIAVLALPTYIALTTFHRELVPTQFLFTVMNAREGTPFPVLLEALIMITAFEILREAGLRLPRPIGQAVSIVGALVMGEAAVSAGLVGTPIVITVAISAVAGYTIPLQAETISITRVLMMFIAAFLGVFGISMGLLAIMLHLAKLKSFGTPYFPSVNPNSDMQDSFIRMPLWTMVERPIDLAGNDKTRRVKKIPPVPEVGNAPEN